MEYFVAICAMFCVLCLLGCILVTALVFKLYTEYWKDVTIQRRYEKKEGG